MMKQNKLLLVMLLFPLFSLNCSSQNIKRIDIKFVEIEIETPYQIRCENFDDFFQSEIDSISINDDKIITEFKEEIGKLNKADLAKYSMPDTRIKISIIYQDSINELCLDRFILSNQIDVFVLSENFKILLKKYSVIK